ncbi:Propanediol dehydratase reactivation factor small subunit [Klebsiella pneumoniae]|nr:propanediol dehydratase reactivation factor small subunit [Klebsiella pneumoniae]
MESSVVAPAIVIAVTDECSEQWRDVLLGIEEEGIPFVLQPQTGGDLIHHAWQAAILSITPGRRRSVRRCR